MLETETEAAELEIDRMNITVVVAVRRNGRKVREIPFQATLCYPFDVAALGPPAVAQARQQLDQEEKG